jgi:hypothetical protein
LTWETVGLIGAALNVIGALLLVVVISPKRKRYEHMTGAHLDDSPPMLLYLKHQSWAGGVVVIGTTLQFLAALFSNG